MGVAETHILKGFSLAVRKVLVQQVVSFLIDGLCAIKTLTSPAHVCWAMEVIGQGFSLPMEDQESVQKAVTLYRIWALEPTYRPVSIGENPQFFLQVSTTVPDCWELNPHQMGTENH
jgi:hypothetical protein